MDADELKKYIDIMNENGLIELEIEEEGRRICLRKAPPHESRPVEFLIENSKTPDRSADPGAQAPAAAVETDENLQTVSSPMVGTFYRAPAPDADPFVQVGDEVEEDTIVCIIEAMKVLNEIKCGFEGKVREILVANGESVEFGTPLLIIEV